MVMRSHQKFRQNGILDQQPKTSKSSMSPIDQDGQGVWYKQAMLPITEKWQRVPEYIIARYKFLAI